MLVGGFAQEPSPTIEVVFLGTERVFEDLAAASSLPRFVSLLVVGDVEES
jgi:hypothetical protein